MTQEIKLKLEQAAESVVMKLYYGKPSKGSSELNEFNEFKSVAITLAQTILENPSEWGLVEAQWKEDAIHNADAGVEIAAERDKYREALERIVEYDFDTKRVSPHMVAKEALKQEVNNDV